MSGVGCEFNHFSAHSCFACVGGICRTPDGKSGSVNLFGIRACIARLAVDTNVYVLEHLLYVVCALLLFLFVGADSGLDPELRE